MITGKTKLIIVAIFCALLGIGSFLAIKLTAIEPGGSCANVSERDSCSGKDAACITSDAGNYCSISCNATSDCPASMKCEQIESATYSAVDGSKTSNGTVKMCIKS